MIVKTDTETDTETDVSSAALDVSLHRTTQQETWRIFVCLIIN